MTLDCDAVEFYLAGRLISVSLFADFRSYDLPFLLSPGLQELPEKFTYEIPLGNRNADVHDTQSFIKAFELRHFRVLVGFIEERRPEVLQINEPKPSNFFL